MGARLAVAILFLLTAACGEDLPETDAGALDGAALDGAALDAGTDAAPADSGPPDASIGDAGPAPRFTLTFTVRLNPMVDAFDLIEGREVTCEIAFPLAAESGSPPRIEYESAAGSVVCAPDPPDVVARLGRNLDGRPARLVVFGTAGSATNRLRFEIEGAPGAEVFRIVATCDATGFPDDGVRPVLGPFSCADGAATLERYADDVSPATLTDQALAIAALSYAEP